MSLGAPQVRAGRRRRLRRQRRATAALALVVFGLFAVSLMAGHTFYGPGTIGRALLGETVPGASFTVGEVRLPRAVLAVVAGWCFGLAGTSFQTLLGNPLAAPDIIGVSSGASVAAVYGLVVLSWPERVVSLMAIGAALCTALVIYLLAYKDGVAGARLILIGIAVSAMAESLVSYLIVGAAPWDLQVAMRWLTGSLNVTAWPQVAPVVIALGVFAPLLGAQSRNLRVLSHGDDAASALGVAVERTRVLVVLAAVGLVACATAACGPIAFVAFLSGPLASAVVGRNGLLIPAALTGSALVLAADLIGQWAFGARYPVGVVTGALGAPYLLVQLHRAHRG